MLVRSLTTAGGVTVRIHDDCYAGVSGEEMERRRRLLSEAILEIDRSDQLRKQCDEGGDNP